MIRRNTHPNGLDPTPVLQIPRQIGGGDQIYFGLEVPEIPYIEVGDILLVIRIRVFCNIVLMVLGEKYFEVAIYTQFLVEDISSVIRIRVFFQDRPNGLQCRRIESMTEIGSISVGAKRYRSASAL